MLSTSVCFVHEGHCVEYGMVRNRVGGILPHHLQDGTPFVEVDGVSIVLTPQLLWGWSCRCFGDAVRAYVQGHYPPKHKQG